MFPLDGAANSMHTGGSTSHLRRLQLSWENYSDRAHRSEEEWINDLSEYLNSLVEHRIVHVQNWLQMNTSRFKTNETTFQGLQRDFESLTVILRSNVQLCSLQCANCNLSCLNARHHEGVHDCHTLHMCTCCCSFTSDHSESNIIPCGLP